MKRDRAHKTTSEQVMPSAGCLAPGAAAGVGPLQAPFPHLCLNVIPFRPDKDFYPRAFSLSLSLPDILTSHPVLPAVHQAAVTVHCDTRSRRGFRFL